MKHLQLIKCAALAFAAAAAALAGCGGEKAVSLNTTAAHADPECDTVKKGVSVSRYNSGNYLNNSGGELIDALECGWWYNWDVRPANTYIDAEFVPMIWGKGNVTEENIAYVRQGFEDGQFTHLLTFNEPDLPGDDGLSANMTVDEAAELWPQLEETGIPLSSPAVSYYSPSEGNEWLDAFMERADEEGLRVDFIAIHLYQSFYSEGVVDDLMATLDALYTKYRLPIWLTEFGAIDIISRDSHRTEVAAGCTEANAVKYMQEACRRMEQCGYVERYSWFVDNFMQTGDSRPWEAPYTTLYSDDDSMSGTGEAYAGLGSSVPLEVVTKTLGEGKLGTRYEQKIEIAGGAGNYALSAQSLPAGLSLEDGMLCGTPQRADYYSVNINIKDAAGQTMNYRYILHIAE